MSYTEEVYERVVAQNPNEPEFHQAVKDHHLVFAGDQRQRIVESGILKVGIFDVIADHNTFLTDSTCLN